MFRSLNLDGTFAALTLAASVFACSSTAEWEKQPGKLELFATPLPPAKGAVMVLGLRSDNVGPVEVFQGDTLIATFLNVELDELKAYEITAVSDEKPRAVGVAFDFERLEVNASPFDGDPPPPEPDLAPQTDAAAPTEPGSTEPGPTEPGATDNCPGVVEVSDGRCSEPTTATRVRFVNTSDSPLSVYEDLPDIIDATRCVPSLKALIPVGESRELDAAAGAVLRVVSDASATTVRRVQLPAVEQCDLVIE
jgi:hypothetical protein